MAVEPSAETLVHFYDELTEAQASIPTRSYKEFLIKWGYDPEQADRLCSRLDRGTGVIHRKDLCKPNEILCNTLPALRDVQILNSDMNQKQAESIMLYVVDVIKRKKSKKDQLEDLKKRLEEVYGKGWNCYMTDGKFYSVCSHEAGTSLVFLLNDMVYGVFRTPCASKH
ncbi:Dynein light chain [Taenia solium]|eukprot:TsM_000566700 transcript=TsM_000566700 gene=TsM_000566700